jgi:NADPH-ferrihemoprotein reductase
MTNTFATHAVSQLSQLGPPQTAADVVALAAVGVASAAYLLNGIAWNRPDPYDHIWYQRMEPRGGAGGGAKATRNIAQKLEESVSEASSSLLDETCY